MALQGFQLHVIGLFCFFHSDAISGPYLQEPETEICSNMLDSLNECIQVCKLYCYKLI